MLWVVVHLHSLFLFFVAIVFLFRFHWPAFFQIYLCIDLELRIRID